MNHCLVLTDCPQLSRANARIVLIPRKEKSLPPFMTTAVFSVTGLIIAFPGISPPAVHLHEDPEISFSERALEKVAALNIKTFAGESYSSGLLL